MHNQKGNTQFLHPPSDTSVDVNEADGTFFDADVEEKQPRRKKLLAEGWIERQHFWFKRGEFGTTMLTKKHVENKSKNEKAGVAESMERIKEVENV
jgi:hypothetical protein